MDENITISPYQPSNDILDFDYLTQKGIKSLQQYTGKLWTDHNTHDPGITILETLCFTLTEMGFRCRYNIEDLMAPPKSNQNTPFSAPDENILFTNPLTEPDFRKLVLDIDNVRNAYVFPSKQHPDFNGLWEVMIEPVPNTNINETIDTIKQVLAENRNLCEDFVDVSIVDYDNIGFEIDINLSGNTDIKRLLLNIFQLLEENLNPSVHYHDLDSLLSKKLSADEIFEGPKPKNGFIIEEELLDIQQRTKLYTADIYHLLMDIPEVDYVRKLIVKDNNGKAHKWVCPVNPNKSATLDLKNTLVNFYLNGKKINVDAKTKDLFDKKMQQSTVKSKHKSLTFNRNTGAYTNVEPYRSVTHDMPEFYGTGAAGLSDNVPKERKGKARQLKAYLMIFDQLNANFLSQLENLSTIFSIEETNNTYFFQVLKDIPGIEHMYVPFIKKCQANNIPFSDNQQIQKLWNAEKDTIFKDLKKSIESIIENENVFVTRRNKILDHLLARFSYKYELQNEVSDQSSTFAQKKLIKKKINILQNILTISNKKIQSINVSNPENINEAQYSSSGFHLSMQSLLGVSSTKKGHHTHLISEDEAKLQQSNKEYLKFFNSSQNEAYKELFKWGLSSENFLVKKSNNKFKIQLTNGDKTIAEYSTDFETEEQAKNKIDQLTKIVENENKQFETFYFFEHILLRPPEKAKAYHFQFFDEFKTNILSSHEALTLEEREKTCQQIIKYGQNPDNYTFEDTGHQQYKFAIQNNRKSAIIFSNMYFSNEKDTRTAAEVTCNTIKKIANKSVPPEKHFTKFTENIIPNLKIDDLYSNIITYIIPDWPSRFLNEHSQQWIENKITEMTPAHIYANIKWVGRDVLLETLNKYFEILHLKQDDENDPEQIYHLQKSLITQILHE
ncbi:MAG: hypothetical protein K9G70_00210 [Prolixibacteraceae bacterium]|nr:hypothetical protein [Prolixibacteraceae bacterium]